MVESFPFAMAIGAVLGLLAGLGVGGGTLLILWLTLIIKIDAGAAAGINLMFFIAAAGAVSLYRCRRGTLHLKAVLPGIAAGCITAAAGSVLRSMVDQQLLEQLFGILLLVTGVRELLYRPKKAI